MISDILKYLGRDNIDRIVTNQSYEDSLYRLVMDKHVAQYVRLKNRVNARCVLMSLLELYLYACQLHDAEYDSALLPDHFAYTYSGIMEFVNSYDQAYDKRASNLCDPSQSFDPEAEFQRNYELFCASTPSIEAHLLLLQNVISLCKVLEKYVWDRLPQTSRSRDSSSIIQELLVDAPLSVDEYAVLLLNENKPDALGIAAEEDDEGRAHARLFIAASEVRTEESLAYEPEVIWSILTEFCDASDGLVSQMIHIVADARDQTEVNIECHTLISQLLRTSDRPCSGTRASKESDAEFASAARAALQGYCLLVNNRYCNTLWPAVIWLVRIARLRLEWKAAQLKSVLC